MKKLSVLKVLKPNRLLEHLLKMRKCPRDEKQGL
jgi:hypothetical protein